MTTSALPAALAALIGRQVVETSTESTEPPKGLLQHSDAGIEIPSIEHIESEGGHVD